MTSGTREPAADTATQANHKDIVTEHLSFDWDIDWPRKVIQGYCTHRLLAKKEGIDRVILDTSYLDIHHCWIEGRKAEFHVAERHPVMGSALTIELPKPMAKGTQALVSVEYSTTDKCTTLGWLEKEQTGSGVLPFLYSQSQAIHGRSLFPCADTPSVKITYDARVRSSIPTATVLLSARRVSPPLDYTPTANKPTTYHYNQPIAIPSYLVAIAAGDIKYAPLGPRTGVYAGPTLLDDSVWEFKEDTEKFVDTAEDLISPYRWGPYDVLILPKSFPYGGMENANLTFLTPTLLAGDRSLVDVVAHELAHSWFGNLVSCSDWGSFWLNEGWTTYLERLIIGKRYGAAHRDFSYIIGRNSLRKSLAEMAKTPKYQRMVVSYAKGEDPDDGYSTVPYDKGSNFLLHLERTVGGLDVFLPYARDYVKTFAGKSIDTDIWRDHLYQYFRQHHGKEGVTKLDSIDWQAWLYGEGPDLAVDVKYDTSLADRAYALADRWEAARDTDDFDSFSASDLKGFDSNQVVVFLERLEARPDFSPDFAAALDARYAFDKTGNTEIRLRWYQVCLKTGPKYAQSAAAWVRDKGRMKFARPVYRLLFKVAPELAQKTFLEGETFYHPIARGMLRKDLQLPPA